jgi:uncharacterized membrane protein
MQRIVIGVRNRLVALFLAGLLAILPLVITIAIIGWVGGIIHSIVGPRSFVGRQLQSVAESFELGTGAAYLVACVVVLAAIFLLGVFVQMGGRRLLHGLFDQVIPRIPLVGSVYTTAAQVVGMLGKSEETDLKGMSVVYCSFGKADGIGLLALLPSPERYRFDAREYYVVFIPTSPVPMTGGLLFVPCESVRPVDINVEALMSIYLSMGVTGPDLLAGRKKAQSAEDAEKP